MNGDHYQRLQLVFIKAGWENSSLMTASQGRGKCFAMPQGKRALHTCMLQVQAHTLQFPEIQPNSDE